MSILTGNDLMLFKKTQVGETITYSTLAYATGCQISMSAGTLETTSKDSGK
jgi:predicted secreted protein